MSGQRRALVAGARGFVGSHITRLEAETRFLAACREKSLPGVAFCVANIFRDMDHGKAQRDLGWSPHPLSDTVRDTVAWFAARERHTR